MFERLAALRYVVVSTAIMLVALVVLVGTRHRAARNLPDAVVAYGYVPAPSAACVDVVPSYVPTDVYR